MANIDIMQLFKIIILVQLFYAFCITGLTHALPADSLNYVTSFSDVGRTIDLDTVSDDVQESLESQTNIGVIELGALVFYSGNILIDLLLNFAFAMPQMFGLLVHGFTMLFNLDPIIFALVELFTAVAIMVLYFIALIQLLTGIRSGRIV